MTLPERTAGVDEAGRGPLAGPVVVAAVILPARFRLEGLGDSKLVQRERREALAPRIREVAIAWAVERIEAEEIDRLNILRATMLGMRNAVMALSPRPQTVLIDGNRAPEDLAFEVCTIVGGDRIVPAISAASILAKVERDAIMNEWHQQYPLYGFDHNHGYPTPEHLATLREHGPCPIHRRSFRPVREASEPGLF